MIIAGEGSSIIFAIALRDDAEPARVQAALAGTKLGDVRCVPILMQYSCNIGSDNFDIQTLKTKCVTELNEWRKRGETWAAQMVIQDLGRKEFVAKTPLRNVPEAEMNALIQFLNSGRNWHREPFEAACTRAVNSANPSERREALHALSQASIHTANPRAIQVLIDRMQRDPDPSVRRAAVEGVWARRDGRITAAMQETIPRETDAGVRDELTKFLQYRKSQKIDAL